MLSTRPKTLTEKRHRLGRGTNLLKATKSHGSASPDEHTQPSPPMIRLRLPSEKPTMDDADKNGVMPLIYEGNYEGKKDAWHGPA